MKPTLRAALWMLGSVGAFSTMAVAGKEVSAVHDSFEIMTLRSAVGLPLVLAIARATGQMDQIKVQRLGGHLLRNVMHFAGQNLWFFALTLIPLAQLFAIEFTSPIWVILLSPLILGEKLTAPRLISALLGFIGILIVTRPDMANLNIGVLAAAGAAICFAATNIATKRLTRGQSIITIMFWLTLMQFCFGMIASFYDGQVSWPTQATLPWLVLIGFCGVVAHYSLTSALSLAPASYVVPIDFLRLPLIAAVGALAYAEPLDPFVLGGGVVIFLGIWISVRAEFAKRL
ncbi:DMT family transporter [Cypionkella sp.]|uniref:DMT family transporter n=1 Tax=Cypionkella sp. TaxID=2811411 RepID=UPI003751B066